MLYSIESHFYCSFLNNNAYELRHGKSEHYCPNNMKHLHRMVKEMKDKKKAEKKNVEKNVPPKNVSDVRVAAIPPYLSMEERMFWESMTEKYQTTDSTTRGRWPYPLPDPAYRRSRPYDYVPGVYVPGVGFVPESEYKFKWSEEMPNLRALNDARDEFLRSGRTYMEQYGFDEQLFYMSAAKGQGMSCLDPGTSDELRIVEVEGEVD